MIQSLKQQLEHPLTRGLDIDSPDMTYLRRQIIREKPFLRRIYAEWYGRIVHAMPNPNGRILELGSGAGFLDDYMPNLITSEVFHLPQLHAVLDATALPFADESLDGIAMTDVFHHIPDVAAMLHEAARCVKSGGGVVMTEPWVSPFSQVIYMHLHHEPFRPDASDWTLDGDGPLSSANGALPWMVFVRDRDRFEREFPEWEIVRIEPFMPFRYLVSGGVSMRTLSPDWSYDLWRNLEGVLEPLMPQLAMFALIALRRR